MQRRLGWLLRLGLLLVLLLGAGCSRALVATSPVASYPDSNPNPQPGALVSEPVFHGQVYVVETGTEHAQTVVLVHGLGENAARDWDAVIPALARTYHVIALDLPGFGRASRDNRLYSPAAYTELLHWISPMIQSRSTDAKLGASKQW